MCAPLRATKVDPLRCLYPRTASQTASGAPLNWSKKKYKPGDKVLQLPCGKCLECRLDYGRQWAIRCVHEAQMHEKNSFVTLTYDDNHLKPRLDYSDFQKFMKRLRKLQNAPIGVFVSGEYGEETKRPHWHAIIFNWEPPDLKKIFETKRGDVVYSSQVLDKVWGLGSTKTGSVTFESAGYCARYAAKKLCHGKDQDHDYHPISKKSSKYAIGKAWLEKFYMDVFNHGEMLIEAKEEIVTSSIPRYYEKWFEKNHPEKFQYYKENIKQTKIVYAHDRAEKERLCYIDQSSSRSVFKENCLTPAQVREVILKSKFQMLQNNLKL